MANATQALTQHFLAPDHSILARRVPLEPLVCPMQGLVEVCKVGSWPNARDLGFTVGQHVSMADTVGAFEVRVVSRHAACKAILQSTSSSLAIDR